MIHYSYIYITLYANTLSLLAPTYVKRVFFCKHKQHTHQLFRIPKFTLFSEICTTISLWHKPFYIINNQSLAVAPRELSYIFLVLKSVQGSHRVLPQLMVFIIIIPVLKNKFFPNIWLFRIKLLHIGDIMLLK